MRVETSQGPADLLDDPGRPGAQVLYLDGLASSHVDLRDPQRLHMDYQWRLGAALDALRPARGEPLDVVHLGGGALALPRFVAATRPRARQAVWEIEPELVALGRRRLGGRKLGLRCGDAAELMARHRRADVVIGDAFVGTALPPQLATPAFAAQVRRVLAPAGLYLLNVVDAPPWEDADAQERILRETFAHVLAFGAREVVTRRRAGNALFAASDAPLGRAALARALSGGAFPGLVREPRSRRLADLADRAPQSHAADAPDAARAVDAAEARHAGDAAEVGQPQQDRGAADDRGRADDAGARRHSGAADHAGGRSDPR
ncbi:MAG: hypothetical protein QOI80_1413 [Solirubrobacteraceae bacterium]|nr:hypothetical protein [Solirubrobacteraceae bacterium]